MPQHHKFECIISAELHQMCEQYVAELVDVCAVSSRHSQLLSVDPQRAAGFPTPYKLETKGPLKVLSNQILNMAAAPPFGVYRSS